MPITLVSLEVFNGIKMTMMKAGFIQEEAELIKGDLGSGKELTTRIHTGRSKKHHLGSKEELGNQGTSPSTMRVIALINGQKAVVLIDTGSTHNFMDKGLVASLKLQVDHTSCFEVKVSNGQITKTMGECKSIKFKIQDLQFKVNFSLLELGDYRGLNKETVKDKFPIPMIDKLLGVLKTRLETLAEHQLYAKLSKCVFSTSEVEYLGHVISGQRVETDPKKIEAMKEWLVPKTLKALRGFLGLTGYYRKFIKGYRQIASPLTALLKKDTFVWSDKAEQAFEKLKEAVSQPPVLALPDFTQSFVVKCDASGVGIGVVLMQQGRLLAFFSQALKGKNLFLSTYEKELLALVLAVKKWRPYLFATIFVIKTDQQSLKYILEQRVAPWGTFLVFEDLDKSQEGLALARDEGPWHSISMDFIEGLPTSNKQNVILVVVDRLTKYVQFIALAHPYTTATVASLFLHHVFKLHDMSSFIVSDRDTAFTSLFWEELFRQQGVDLAMSSSYHP
uniref:Integrase catalytic domain-containing protein n=1 Tax=Fagus sylvatica TaxID=28930 RepID=A0A2N9EIS5_FAGSY